MYVIIGATGFLGRYLIKNIMKSTTENILAVARHIPSQAQENIRLKWECCDIADEESTLEFYKKALIPAISNTGGRRRVS